MQEALAPPVESRRTDDILFNIRYLARLSVSSQVGIEEMLEQNDSDIGESDVHNLGVHVEQKLCQDGEYRRMGETDVERTEKGRDAVVKSDEKNEGEYAIRNQDVVLARRLRTPESRKALQEGALSLYLSPSPTEKEMDLEVAVGYGYDGRTMLRFESISPDGLTKSMDSFSIFDVPIGAWQEYIYDTHDVYIEPTALSVMKFFSEELPLQRTTIPEALKMIVGGVAKFTETDVQAKLHVQLHDFLHRQEELKRTTRHYSLEKLELQKELAKSLGSFATPLLVQRLDAVKDHLNVEAESYIDAMWTSRGLKVDEVVAKILTGTHTVNINNRAGLAVSNRLTLMRLKARVGQEMTESMSETEQKIVKAANSGADVEFMIRRNDQLIAESGAGCGGNCSVSIVDLYSPEGKAARAAGLTGTLYKSMELSNTSKCSCIAKKQQPNVVVNGKDVICTNCGEFKVNGKWGTLADEQKSIARKVIVSSLLDYFEAKTPSAKQELIAA